MPSPKHDSTFDAARVGVVLRRRGLTPFGCSREAVGMEESPLHDGHGLAERLDIRPDHMFGVDNTLIRTIDRPSTYGAFHRSPPRRLCQECAATDGQPNDLSTEKLLICRKFLQSERPRFRNSGPLVPQRCPAAATRDHRGLLSLVAMRV